MNLELYILNTISCLGTRSKSYASRQGTPSPSIIPTPTSNFDNKVFQLNLNTVRTTPLTFCIYFSTIKCTEHQPNPQKPTFIVHNHTTVRPPLFRMHTIIMTKLMPRIRNTTNIPFINSFLLSTYGRNRRRGPSFWPVTCSLHLLTHACARELSLLLAFYRVLFNARVMTIVFTISAIIGDRPPTYLLQRIATPTAMTPIQPPTLIDIRPKERHPMTPTLLTPLPIAVRPIAWPCRLLRTTEAARACS